MVSRFWTLALAEVSYKYGFSSVRPFVRLQRKISEITFQFFLILWMKLEAL